MGSYILIGLGTAWLVGMLVLVFYANGFIGITIPRGASLSATSFRYGVLRLIWVALLLGWVWPLSLGLYLLIARG
jgi:hypothetical protein